MSRPARYIVRLECEPFRQGRRWFQRWTAFPVWARSQDEADTQAAAELARSDFRRVAYVRLAT